jgi:hypothetical protein
LPLPVTVKRLAAERRVLILGIGYLLKIDSAESDQSACHTAGNWHHAAKKSFAQAKFLCMEQRREGTKPHPPYMVKRAKKQ